jgi:endonuclease/exonuclease/phosphatase family metal-dependent hydrolase
MKRLSALLLGIGLASACRDADVTGPDASFARALPATRAGGVTVMTRNLYLGTDLNPLLAAPPPLVAFVAAETFARIQATDFPARAEVLADEIAATNPDLVGLQEATLYRVQTPGDAALGGLTPATTVFQDFLAILLDALRARGLDYHVAVVQENTDVEVPAFTGNGPDGLPTFTDVRLTDRDVILARGDVEVSDPEHDHYAVNQPVVIGGRPVLFLRGWLSLVASAGGHTFRFFNTHLETEMFPAVQTAQATELIGVTRAVSLPVLLVGDFNSDATGTQTPTYGLLATAGFRDAWLQARPRTGGLTCCHAADLGNEEPTLDRRIDLVLIGRGFMTPREGEDPLRVHAIVVGDEPADRTPSGLWPSDHAGVVARLNERRLWRQ